MVMATEDHLVLKSRLHELPIMMVPDEPLHMSTPFALPLSPSLRSIIGRRERRFCSLHLADNCLVVHEAVETYVGNLTRMSLTRYNDNLKRLVSPDL
jgi:hypothetical protein